MTTLITGAAGFIGYHVAEALLARSEKVVGVDNLNSYYDVALKKARLSQLESHKNFLFRHIDITDRSAMEALARNHPEITHIIHLAAQPGVRYSLENPLAYIESNIIGQMVILELARHHLPKLEHLVYASSSSVYGGNTKLPFSVNDPVDSPVSLYAATKKADELMGHCYSHLYGIPMTGLRFFTVYGPWGRPDMATYSFTKAIFDGKPIQVYNQGDMKRDFTYVDDIVQGVLATRTRAPSAASGVPHKVYNLGNHQAEPLLRFIEVLENAVGKKAIIELKPMQDGDVKETYADITETTRDLGFKPTTSIDVGLPKFVEWFRGYHGV
ncbi:MAG: NAD-dependent epimerase/dehydratase family protein [Rickettsiales bacterium]|nr:NAD-dependent epimerase/dehydratase family protein [Rickettsiales bacterium]